MNRNVAQKISSIGSRLTLAIGALSLTAVGIIVMVVYLATLGHFDEQVADDVHTEISELVTMYTRNGSQELVREIGRRSQSSEGRSTVYLLEQTGGSLTGNLDSWPADLSDSNQLSDIRVRPATGPQTGSVSVTRELRVRSVRVGAERLLVGRDVSQRSDLVSALRTGALAALAAAVLLTIGTGLAISRNLLGRVQGMNSTIARMRAGSTDERVPTSGRGDEFDQLASQFNELSAENRRLIERTREVTNNIAHDLRTPLARMRRTLESAIGDTASQRDEALHTALAETDSLLETFNGLLSLAQIESGALCDTMEPVALDELASSAIELYEPVAEETGIRLEASLQPGATAKLNRHLIAQSLTNLIDNAIKYAAAGGVIRVATVAAAKGVGSQLIVEDAGPGIPKTERQRVLERFTRLDESRGLPGTGLGLSFVAAVAELHHATLALEDAAPGLRVNMTFPRERAS